MTAVQVMILLFGFLLLATAMSALMVRFNRSQQAVMQRRREAWIADGADPDKEPQFYGCGSGG